MYGGLRKFWLNGPRRDVFARMSGSLQSTLLSIQEGTGRHVEAPLCGIHDSRAFGAAAALASPPTPLRVPAPAAAAAAPLGAFQPGALPQPGFRQFALSEAVVRGAEGVGLLEPTEVQRRGIPLVLTGQSAFLSAETGTGKTAAYALPLLELLRQQLERERGGNQDGDLNEHSPLPEGLQRPLCLVLTPTADLASQVHAHFVALARGLPHVRVDLLTAASATPPARQAQLLLQRQAEVLVATPGRLLRLLQQASAGPASAAGALSLAGVRHWVVDECDRVARMGLLRDVQQLFPFLPRPPKDAQQPPMQVLLVSATVTPEAAFLLRRFAPRAASVALNPDLRVAAAVKHVAYTVHSRRKVALLEYLLKRKGSFRDSQVLVFTRTRQRAARLAAVLAERGVPAEAVHSGLTGTQRWRVVEAFKARAVRCVVATAVLGRGIDIPDLPTVINFDLPLTPEDYVHHVGRTGRAGQAGLAVSLVSADAQEVLIGGPHQRAVLREEQFLAAVEALTGERVERRKVPGPWRDVERDRLDDTLAEGSRRGGQGRASETDKRSERLGRSNKNSEGQQSGPTTLADSTSGPGVTVTEVVEGMERGLARRAGIKRLKDVERRPRGRTKRRSGRVFMTAAPSG
ncbi:hypothetical protein KFL_009640020 [Klebsormidium nitens]|uniref:Uncharacterized protein n=1 Tax=Klebsormidium nitens TaxID=105231 RepID=A0A1Y1IUB9_KLENI|nr:hypothetical protein KFL_009640020 [Klebsormidium nitens]|eukprot:GAQ92277.1 hypothetical protein KFL_009640020 [Klebsormidium nitens]